MLRWAVRVATITSLVLLALLTLRSLGVAGFSDEHLITRASAGGRLFWLRYAGDVHLYAVNQWPSDEPLRWVSFGRSIGHGADFLDAGPSAKGWVSRWLRVFPLVVRLKVDQRGRVPLVMPPQGGVNLTSLPRQHRAFLIIIERELLFTLCLLLPGGWLVRRGLLTLRRLQHRSRAEACLCVKCRYDLRASTGRCPECGTPISDRDVHAGSYPSPPQG